MERSLCRAASGVCNDGGGGRCWDARKSQYAKRRRTKTGNCAPDASTDCCGRIRGAWARRGRRSAAAQRGSGVCKHDVCGAGSKAAQSSIGRFAGTTRRSVWQRCCCRVGRCAADDRYQLCAPRAAWAAAVAGSAQISKQQRKWRSGWSGSVAPAAGGARKIKHGGL
ncbi:hypothetical protein GGI11_005014 [Coemansia sp. RSA 2049]|nr:hypothetical protein GGI11_005014 [Coemansia sp. RSA 2049]